MKFNLSPGILFSLCLVALQYAHATGTDRDMPAYFTATYTLHGKGLTLGKMERIFTREADGNYRFSSYSYPTGLARLFRHDRIREASLFRIRDNEVQPLEYTYDHRGGKKDRQVKVIFDWDKSSITNTLGKHHWRMQTTPGVLDKLVYQLALMRHLRQGKTQLHYRIADGGRIKDYVIQMQGKDTLETPLGSLETVRLLRQKASSKRMTTLWCAPALDFLPVRVEHREKDGNITTARLVALKGMQLPAASRAHHQP